MLQKGREWYDYGSRRKRALPTGMQTVQEGHIMGLFDFLKRKKKKKNVEIERSMPVTLDGFDPSTVVPPDTRYTQEYQEFLAAQEAAGQKRELSDTAEPSAEENAPEEGIPCGECGEDAVPAGIGEEEIREHCEDMGEVVEEAGSAEETPENIPVEEVIPEADDIPAAQEAADQSREFSDAAEPFAEETAPEEATPCGDCGEEAAPAETGEEEIGECCEAVEEALPAEEAPEDIPVEEAAPEAGDIISNE